MFLNISSDLRNMTGHINKDLALDYVHISCSNAFSSSDHTPEQSMFIEHDLIHFVVWGMEIECVGVFAVDI